MAEKSAPMPGPYRYGNVNRNPVNGEKFVRLRDAERRYIAEIAFNGPMEEATANLLKAAPDLLAACEDTLRELGDIDPIGGRLRAALAKARGETT